MSLSYVVFAHVINVQCMYSVLAAAAATNTSLSLLPPTRSYCFYLCIFVYRQDYPKSFPAVFIQPPEIMHYGYGENLSFFALILLKLATWQPFYGFLI